jgi:hypothetical protein
MNKTKKARAFFVKEIIVNVPVDFDFHSPASRTNLYNSLKPLTEASRSYTETFDVQPFDHDLSA